MCAAESTEADAALLIIAQQPCSAAGSDGASSPDAGIFAFERCYHGTHQHSIPTAQRPPLSAAGSDGVIPPDASIFDIGALALLSEQDAEATAAALDGSEADSPQGTAHGDAGFAGRGGAAAVADAPPGLPAVRARAAGGAGGRGGGGLHWAGPQGDLTTPRTPGVRRTATSALLLSRGNDALQQPLQRVVFVIHLHARPSAHHCHTADTCHRPGHSPGSNRDVQQPNFEAD